MSLTQVLPIDILLTRFSFARMPKSEKGPNSTMKILTEKKKKIQDQLILHQHCIYEM